MPILKRLSFPIATHEEVQIDHVRNLLSSLLNEDLYPDLKTLEITSIDYNSELKQKIETAFY